MWFLIVYPCFGKTNVTKKVDCKHGVYTNGIRETEGQNLTNAI